MSAGTTAVFISTPRTWHVHLDTGNSNLDGVTGTYETLATGAVAGSRIDRINLRANGPTTAGMIRFFVDDGVLVTFLHEIPVTMESPDATTPAWNSEWKRTEGQPLVVLPDGWNLLVSTENSEDFDVIATFGGDF